MFERWHYLATSTEVISRGTTCGFLESRISQLRTDRSGKLVATSPSNTPKAVTFLEQIYLGENTSQMPKNEGSIAAGIRTAITSPMA